MEAIKLDMQKFCAKLKQLPKLEENQFHLETPGEQYIYNLIVKATLEECDIPFDSIDFEQFDADDIENFIDIRFSDYSELIEKTESVVRQFYGSSARTDGKKKFF